MPLEVYKQNQGEGQEPNSKTSRNIMQSRLLTAVRSLPGNWYVSGSIEHSFRVQLLTYCCCTNIKLPTWSDNPSIHIFKVYSCFRTNCAERYTSYSSKFKQRLPKRWSGAELWTRLLRGPPRVNIRFGVKRCPRGPPGGRGTYCSKNPNAREKRPHGVLRSKPRTYKVIIVCAEGVATHVRRRCRNTY